MDMLKRLQVWYEKQCDGDWEHDYGVRIGTLDNPGWEIDIDLEYTELAERTFEKFQNERTENDWIACRIEEKRFRGFGGPQNLDELLRTFLDWAEKYAGGRDQTCDSAILSTRESEV